MMVAVDSTPLAPTPPEPDATNNNNNSAAEIPEAAPTEQAARNGEGEKRTLAEKAEMIIDEDPLLISQTLTYVTDDGSVLHAFQSAPFSFAFKLRFVILEAVFVLLLVAAVPIGAHGTVVAVSIANLLAVAWFWYNLVRSVDVTKDGALRFWIGNIEIDVPFDKIVSIRRIALTTSPCSCFMSIYPYRGFLSNPMDGVAIVTTVPSTPFWLWPRSAGKPDRSCCYGALRCPRLTVIFSPSGGGLAFIREVENEMRNFSQGAVGKTNNNNNNNANNAQSQSTMARGPQNPDFLDV